MGRNAAASACLGQAAFNADLPTTLAGANATGVCHSGYTGTLTAACVSVGSIGRWASSPASGTCTGTVSTPFVRPRHATCAFRLIRAKCAALRGSTECAYGTFKSTAGPTACTQCGVNSNTTATARTNPSDCLCYAGYTGIPCTGKLQRAMLPTSWPARTTILTYLCMCPNPTQSVALERTRLRWAAATAQRALQAQPRRPLQASLWHSAHALLATRARTAALAQVYLNARTRPCAGGPCAGGVRSHIALFVFFKSVSCRPVQGCDRTGCLRLLPSQHHDCDHGIHHLVRLRL